MSLEFHADSLVIIAVSLEECVGRLLMWKEATGEKRLGLKEEKTKVIICRTGLDLLQIPGEFPCPG